MVNFDSVVAFMSPSRYIPEKMKFLARKWQMDFVHSVAMMFSARVIGGLFDTVCVSPAFQLVRVCG